MMKKWPPNANTTGYGGPYPVNDIQKARQKLIQCLMPPHSLGLAKALPKIGIDSCFGPGLVPPPPQAVPNGLTISDNYRPSPEKTVAAPPVSVTKSNIVGMHSQVKVSDWTPLRVSRSVSVQDTRQDTGHTRIHDSHTASVPITKRRYSELPATGDVTGKRPKDNGVIMANKHQSLGDVSVAGDSPSCRHSAAKLLTSRVYKCDFCRVTATSDVEMTSHLIRSRHASASEYSISSGGDASKGGPELQAVEQMLALSNPNKNYCAALVIACPECRSIFDDIFACATHNKYEHGESDGCYAVCPVIHSEKVEVHGTSCSVCQCRFNDHNDLVEHWVAIPDHCPTPQSTDSRVFLVQTCPACKRTFNDDFLDCVIHMGEEHGSVTPVEVRHVMLPQRRERLPPFSANTGGLRDEAAVLSRLQNCFEQNAINARLEQIQKILADVDKIAFV